MMKHGLRVTIRRGGIKTDAEAVVMCDHVVTVSAHDDVGVFVDTIRGVMHVVEVEGREGDEVTVQAFFDEMQGRSRDHVVDEEPF